MIYYCGRDASAALSMTGFFAPYLPFSRQPHGRKAHQYGSKL
jgi:hypothetical protein